MRRDGFSQKGGPFVFFWGKREKEEKVEICTVDSKFMLGLDCLVVLPFFASLYGLYCMIMHAEIV